MKKVIIVFTILVILLVISFILIDQYTSNYIEEVTYSVKSEYLYLSNGDVQFNVKVYSNDENSLLKYAKKSEAVIHDRSEENIVTVDVIDSYLSSSTTYEEALYEYTLTIKLAITNLKIKDCYLSLKYPNKVYVFNIGNLEISENYYDENILKITNLYGLSSSSDLGLKAIVLTINNNSLLNYKITNIYTGNNINFIVNNTNKITINNSSFIDDYSYGLDSTDITLKANENSTFILPINNTLDCYLYNCYLLIEINGKTYYLSNFTYINSNDLFALERYIIKGIIYDI